MKAHTLGSCIALLALLALCAAAAPSQTRTRSSKPSESSLDSGVVDRRAATDPSRLRPGQNLVYSDQRAFGGQGVRLYASARPGEPTTYTATRNDGQRIRLRITDWTLAAELRAEAWRRAHDRAANRAEERRRRWEEAFEEAAVAAEGKSCYVMLLDIDGTLWETPVRVKCRKGI